MFHHHRKTKFCQLGDHIGHGGYTLFTREDLPWNTNSLRLKRNATAPDINEERGCTGIDESSGAANTGHDTSKSAAKSTTSRKRREPTQEQHTDRPRRQIKPIERLSAGTKDSSHRQAHMTTALAAAVSSGDMFTNLAVDQIQKEGTTKPRAEHMQREDFEPPTREYMQQCAFRDKWETGEQEELRSIEKHAVWRKQAHITCRLPSRSRA